MSSPNVQSSMKTTKTPDEPSVTVNISDKETTVMGMPRNEDLLTDTECMPKDL